jgi:hypothetical protein
LVGVVLAERDCGVYGYQLIPQEFTR